MFSVRDFARTYATRGAAGPGDTLRDYREAMRLYEEQGYEMTHAEIADSVGIPKDRFQNWINGTVPSPVRSADDARKRGWPGVDPDSDIGRAMAQLVVGIMACGAIDPKN